LESRESRKALSKMLKPNTVGAIAKPEKIAIQGDGRGVLPGDQRLSPHGAES
jgi:hypothetical protein